MFKKLFFLLIAFYVAPTQASLIFTVDEMTTDKLTFSINGTFDEDSVGVISPGVLAIKYDWTNNFGDYTDFITGHPTVTSSTIAVNGALADINVGSTPHSTNDAIYFYNPLGSQYAFTAGTTLSGSATLELLNAFDPSVAAELELLSGYTMVYTGVFPVFDYDWARLEATAQVLSAPTPSVVPLPTTLLLILSGLLMFAFNRARTQYSSAVGGLTPINA